MAVYGQWYGGHSYAAPSVQDTEQFPSLQHAKEAFEARVANSDGRTPCVEGSTMWIFYEDPRTTGADHPDMLYDQRPDGTTQVSRC